MGKVTPRFFRKHDAKDNSSVAEGPSVQKMSQELERLFAPPDVESINEEKKESELVQDIYDSNNLIEAGASSMKYGDREVFHAVIGNSAADEEGNFGREQTQRKPASAQMNDAAANVMAHHVVNKLRKDAAAMLRAGEGAVPFHRSASPMARMRDINIQMETMDDADKSPKKESKSDLQVKQEKSRQWKKNSKIAQAKQRREKHVLHSEYTDESSTKFRSSNVIGCVLDNVEKAELFKRLAQCGGGINIRNACTENDCEESDYGSTSSMGRSASSMGSEFYSEDYHTEDYQTEEEDHRYIQENNRGRAARSRKNKWETSSPDSSVDRYNTSVDTTVPEELTKSFLSEASQDRHEEGVSYRSRSELNQSLESTHSVPTTTDHAFIGFSSLGVSDNTKVGVNGVPRDNKQTTPLFVKLFLQDMETKGESMLWHKENSSLDPLDPTKVVIRIKRGYRLRNGTYCAPRLIWTDVQKNENFGVDVFDIRSMNHASMVHLKEFPYAIPGRSVVMHLKDSSPFIFEAAAEEVVLRFVRGIRWVIARLAYNLVTGNIDGSCELLDVEFAEPTRLPAERRQRSSQLKRDWSRAMDDVTELLINNALESTFEV